MKILLLFCFYLSFITFGFSQWNNIGLPYGYHFHSSYIDQKGNMFIESKEDIFYSDDYGKTWVKTGLVTPPGLQYGLIKITELENHDLLINKGNEVYKFNRTSKNWDLFVKGKYSLRSIDSQGHLWYDNNDPIKNGIMLTKDAGNTYQQIENYDPQIFCNAFMFDSYKDSFNIMLTGCDNTKRLYRFTETGNFTLLLESDLGNFLYINPATASVFILNKDGKLCRSSDMGSTIIPCNLPLDVSQLSTPFIQLLENGKLLLREDYDFYISEDDGINWVNFQDKTSPDALSSFFPGSVAFLNSSDTLIAVSNDCIKQGSYLSTDKGVNWKRNKDNLFIPAINNLYEDKNGSLYANTCSDSTLLISKDDGISWSQFLINCNNKQYGVVGIAENDNGDIYAVSGSNVFKSKDKGLNFINLALPVDVFSFTPISYIKVLQSGNICVGSYYAIIYSKDGGDSWELIDFNGTYYSNLLMSETGDVFAFDNFHKLFKYNPMSNDMEPLDLNNTLYIRNIEFTKNGLIYFEADDTSGTSCWISKDKLKTYEKIDNVPYYVRKFFSDDKSNIYVECIDSIFVSDDLGKSFNFLTKIPDFSLDYYVSPSQHLFAFDYSYPEIFKFSNKLSSRSIITGKVFNDGNKDCTFDLLESIKPYIQVQGVGQNNTVTFSLEDGKYYLRLENGSYDISAIAPNKLWEPCGSNKVNINQIQDTSFINLGLKSIELCPYLNLQVQVPLMKRCFDNNIYIRYCNEGTAISNNTKLQVTLNDKLNYNSSSINPKIINGNELTFNLGNLESGECGTIVINAKLSCEAKNGDQICLNASLSPVVSCLQSLPDLSFNDKCILVTGSFDPNEKTAYINGKVANGNTEKNQDIEYLIKFQNTGTDTAFRVVVKDKLPEGFDINTFKPLNSSHPYTLEIDDQRTISFIFDPIALPDSNINEAVSHGFIAFKISPKKDLSYGTKLDNYADIYFDYNAAVKTNTSYLTVSQTTASYDILNGIKFNYYPNPTKGELKLNMADSKFHEYTLKISDILGKDLFNDNWTGSTYDFKPKGDILPGIYFIRIIDENGRNGFGKFIIQ